MLTLTIKPYDQPISTISTCQSPVHRHRAGGGGCTKQEDYIPKDSLRERRAGEADAPPIEPVELRLCGSRLGEDSACTLALLKRSIESAPGSSASMFRMARAPRPTIYHHHLLQAGSLNSTYFPYSGA